MASLHPVPWTVNQTVAPAENLTNSALVVGNTASPARHMQPTSSPPPLPSLLLPTPLSTPHTHALSSFPTLLSSFLPLLHTACTILSTSPLLAEGVGSRGAVKGCHHHHHHHRTYFPWRRERRGGFSFSFSFSFSPSLSPFFFSLSDTKMLLSRCVCSCVTRLTVVFWHSVLRRFVHLIFLLLKKNLDKSKRYCGRTAQLPFVARHLMDSWLKYLDCLYETIFHAHPLERTYLSHLNSSSPLTSPPSPSHTYIYAPKDVCVA